MDVYIRGIEMPTSCSVCPMLEGDRMDGLCHAASKWLDDDEHWTWYVYPEGDIDDSKPCNCPLVPVPPHGRLIDADALAEQYAFAQEQRGKDKTDYSNAFMNNGELCTEWWCVEDMLENAPTVLESEEGET